MLVYSVDDRQSFDLISTLREQALHCLVQVPTHYAARCPFSAERYQGTSCVPLVIVENKADLISRQRVCVQEGPELAKAWGLPFIKTSAMNEHSDISEAIKLVIAQHKKNNCVSKRFRGCCIG
jgi:predicted N-formylglutamate amidohydrolase